MAPIQTINALSMPTQNLIIGPAIVHKTILVGTSQSGSITIANQGKTSYSFTLYSTPYGMQNANYHPLFIALPGFANITSWFHLDLAKGFLSPGSADTIKYSINVPTGTAPGSYYAAIFAQTQTSLFIPSKNVLQLSQRVGSLFYINVPGKVNQGGSINQWRLNIMQPPSVKGSLSLKNTGKLYYIANINVNFSNLLGKTEYKFYTQKIIVPRIIRSIPINWPTAPSFGIFKVTGSVTIYGQRSLGTKYILVMSKEVSWLMGIMLILILLFVIINLVKK